MIVDKFFFFHFCLLFTFISPQHFGQCQTGACGFYAKMLTLNIFDEFLSFFKSQLYLIWKAIKINCIVKIWSFLRNQNVKCTFLIQIGPQCTCVVLYRRRQSAQISVKLGNNSILSKKSFFLWVEKNMHTSKLVDGSKRCRAHFDLTCTTLFCKKILSTFLII